MSIYSKRYLCAVLNVIDALRNITDYYDRWIMYATDHPRVGEAVNINNIHSVEPSSTTPSARDLNDRWTIGSFD